MSSQSTTSFPPPPSYEDSVAGPSGPGIQMENVPYPSAPQLQYPPTQQVLVQQAVPVQQASS